MNFAVLVSTSASSALSETWNVCSAIEPVFRLRSFVWLTGFLCCLRNTHAERTSYGSPSRMIILFGSTSLYDNIPGILFEIARLSTPSVENGMTLRKLCPTPTIHHKGKSFFRANNKRGSVRRVSFSHCGV